MAATIHRMKLSLVWTELHLQHLEEDIPADHPFRFLSRDYLYRRRFEELVRGVGDPLGLEAPWPHPKGQMFWTRYFEDKDPGLISGKEAWRRQVPFRVREDVNSTLPGKPGRMLHEVFIHPHGLTYVGTAVCRPGCGLKQSVELALRLYREKFKVDWPEGRQERLTWKMLAERILERRRIEAFGQRAPLRSSIEPFSVFSVLQGSGVAPAAPIKQRGPIHRALQCLASWPPSHSAAIFTPLAEASLDHRRKSDSHVLYAEKRGRVIWLPDLFLHDGALRSISCYHRNLVFAALQVESLGQLIAHASATLRQGGSLGEKLPLLQLSVVRLAAGAMGRLYGKRNTYASWSVRRHIADNFQEDTDLVREHLQMSKLASPP